MTGRAVEILGTLEAPTPASLELNVCTLEIGAKTCASCAGLLPPRYPQRIYCSKSIGHVIPRSMSGSNDLANLRATHWRCNDEKGDVLPSWAIA